MSKSGLFMNDTTMGFMLEAIPINGANESIVEALDHMLRTKLPRGIPLCIHLMSSQLVGDRIEYGLREFSWSGEQAERFNAITRAYYMKAAATQFPLPEGMNLPLTLRHYRVFISYCSPSKKKSRADILEMENLVKIIRASLQGASITTQTVDAQAFIDIVGEMINHNPDSLYPKRRQLDPYSDLNYQCVEDSFDLKVRADYLTLGLRENGRNSTARILNFHLARNRLWGWAVFSQFWYYFAGFPWYEGNILFAFAVAAQVLTWCETRSGWRTAAAILMMALWGPLSGTSYGIAGLLMLAVSHRLYRAEDRMERLVLVACLLAVIPALNLATSDAAAVAGLVMTVLTVGLVSCAGKLLSRFWPGDFFPTFYACHLAVLGVLAL